MRGAHGKHPTLPLALLLRLHPRQTLELEGQERDPELGRLDTFHRNVDGDLGLQVAPNVRQFYAEVT